MLKQQDLQQIAEKGISERQIEKQLNEFKTGFPFLKIDAAAALGHGIFAFDEQECQQYIGKWKDYKNEGHTIVKFVPASGAASRMFKDLFSFLHANYSTPTTDFEKTFFTNITKFAFFNALDAICQKNEGYDVNTLISNGKYKAVVENLLLEKGLNYGQLPKGLLLFHKYQDGPRTPMEEHLVEAALYASCKGKARIHFTVSHEHIGLFKKKVEEKEAKYAHQFNLDYDITFSEQKPSTDTIAVNEDNTPFRTDDGKLLFRPGGHGALIENLNDIKADIVFIKNIDNVVPDRLKDTTVKYKQLLAGVLVSLQQQVFKYLEELKEGNLPMQKLQEMLYFLEHHLCCHKGDAASLSEKQLTHYLKTKFNRPMRVCGVVKNVGEPGGGPFLTYNADGTISLQILESSQIDKSNTSYQEMFKKGTHFNPVDLVCSIRDFEGKPFHLPDFVDHTTGFISSKSKNGKALKALELPGLWNGAMSNWNTVFVEVPLATFNPVKTVNDLLREQHQ